MQVNASHGIDNSAYLDQAELSTNAPNTQASGCENCGGIEFSEPASSGAPPSSSSPAGEPQGDVTSELLGQLSQILKSLMELIQNSLGNEEQAPPAAPSSSSDGGGAPASGGGAPSSEAAPASGESAPANGAPAAEPASSGGSSPGGGAAPAGENTTGPAASEGSAPNNGAAANDGAEGAGSSDGAQGANTDGKPDAPGADSAESPSPAASSNTGGAGNGGEVTEFETMEPGEAPNISRNEDGKIKLDKVVDDSFIPEEDRAAMKESISENKDMDFYKENFDSEEDIYNFQVARMNLESARGTTLENDSDAQGTGGGSFGFAHLHDKFGLEEEKYGSPLNTEGWSKDEVEGDMGKYMDLVMRSDEGNYQFSKEQGKDDPLANSMGMWWTGSEDNAEAGDYYLSAMSAGKGVNHETGSNML